MKKLLLLAAVLTACEPGPKIEPIPDWVYGESSFLVLTNSICLDFGRGSYVVSATSAEWKLLTNHYPNKIKQIKIYFD